MGTDMTQKYRMFRRASGVYYLEDTQTRVQQNLRTYDETEATRLFQAKNEAHRQPAINLQIARAYLAASDPKMVKRTWQDVMEAIVSMKKDETHRR